MTYQDIEDGAGRLLMKGQRDCAERYRLITQAVPKYQRPWTLIDLGAAQGYFGCRFMREDEQCCAVMVDHPGATLDGLLEQKQPEFGIGLRKRLTAKDLEELADCEHFDVILALNILHHLDDPRRALYAVLRLGNEIVVEVPGPDDPAACGDSHEWLEREVKTLGGIWIGETPSHTTPTATRRLYLFHRSKSTLRTPYLGASEQGAPPMRGHHIVSTSVDKVWAMPDKGEGRVWFPGINLQTYLKWGGFYPKRARVRRLVEDEVNRALHGSKDVGFTDIRHKDVRPWNFILSGRDTVTLIDWNDPRQGDDEDDAEGLERTLKAIEEAE